MSYIMTTEISPVQEYKEQALQTLKDTVRSLGMIYFDLGTPSTPNIELPNYIISKISDETYDFIQNVAIVTHRKFGEKEYVINDLKFTIWAEEDYEKQFGKLQE